MTDVFRVVADTMSQGPGGVTTDIVQPSLGAVTVWLNNVGPQQWGGGGYK